MGRPLRRSVGSSFSLPRAAPTAAKSRALRHARAIRASVAQTVHTSSRSSSPRRARRADVRTRRTADATIPRTAARYFERGAGAHLDSTRGRTASRDVVGRPGTPSSGTRRGGEQPVEAPGSVFEAGFHHEFSVWLLARLRPRRSIFPNQPSQPPGISQMLTTCGHRAVMPWCTRCPAARSRPSRHPTAQGVLHVAPTGACPGCR